MKRLLAGVVCALMISFALSLGTAAGANQNWASWRGPQSNGHSDEKGLPHDWNDDLMAWKTPLKGDGQSSPIVWGERVFLTTSLENGRQRMVFCVDRRNGRILWEQIAWQGDPEPTHNMNGWASASCTTDGERVYAFFGKGGGLHCYSVGGSHVWSRDLGLFEGPWGTAASPLLVGDTVVQNCDSDQNAYLVALDRQTGQEIWKTNRPDHRGWSTPVLISAEGRNEIVVNGHTGVDAYDPATGKKLWHCRCRRGRGSPTVTPAKGLLFVANGLSGGGVYCVKPGGSGDVTQTRRRWFTQRGGRDLPSPIVIGDTVMVIGLRGAILTAYDIDNGDELWKERIGGQCSASPVAFDDLAFFQIENGQSVVVDPAADQKVVRRNSLNSDPDELFRASITPLGGQLFIRSNRHLYCIGKRAELASR